MSGAGARNGKAGGGGGGASFALPALNKAAYRGKSLPLKELYEGLFLIDNAFTVEECRGMIAAVEATGQIVSTNPRNLPPRKGHAFRNNERFLVRGMACCMAPRIAVWVGGEWGTMDGARA